MTIRVTNHLGLPGTELFPRRETFNFETGTVLGKSGQIGHLVHVCVASGWENVLYKESAQRNRSYRESLKIFKGLNVQVHKFFR